MLEAWAQGASWKDDAIEDEAPELLEELRRGRVADARMGRILLPEVYESSRFAFRLSIGKEDIIKTFKP